MLVQRLPPTSTTLPAPAAVKVIAPRCSTRSTAFPACTAHSRLRISQRDATGLTTELSFLFTDRHGRTHQSSTQHTDGSRPGPNRTCERQESGPKTEPYDLVDLANSQISKIHLFTNAIKTQESEVMFACWPTNGWLRSAGRKAI